MRIRLMLSAPHAGFKDEALREASRATEVPVASLKYGRQSVEIEYEELRTIPGMFQHAREAEQDGCDAVISDRFGDPEVKVTRELVDIPAVGSARHLFCSNQRAID